MSSLSHLAAAAVFSVANLWGLHKARGNKLRVTALVINFVCVLYLFSMSGVYHLLDPAGAPRLVLQRLDHSAIWSMIAGTFTPIHLILFRGFWRWGVLLLVWTAAITGLVLETIYFHEFPEALSLSLYLGLGWCGVASGWRFHHLFRHDCLRYLIYGGIAYSIGGVLEFLRWPILWQGVIGPHELFHGFVVLGAYFHWRFIIAIFPFAPHDQMTFVAEELPEGRYKVWAIGENIKFQASSKQQIHTDIHVHLERSYVYNAKPKVICLQYVYKEWMDVGS